MFCADMGATTAIAQLLYYTQKNPFTPAAAAEL